MAQPEITRKTAPKPKWQTKLARKSISTAGSYKPHIETFIEVMGKCDIFVQEDIDDYFDKLKKADDRKPQDKRESEATKVMRKNALSFYIKDCLGLKIEFKSYETKSSR